MTFFAELPELSTFAGVVEPDAFRPAPSDWVVVVADVRSSTRAVEQGRYKDVNMVGGCVICAALNALGREPVPFVFGGDGATLLVPAAGLSKVRDALVRTRTLAREAFDLELRVGFVPVADIRALGRDVLVARYEVSPGNDLAMFTGGGVELADRLIKDDADGTRYAVPAYELPGRPDLTGLSCRWEPLRSQRGRVLCVLVRPRTDEPQRRLATLARVLDGVTGTLGADLDRASPVTAGSMRFRWPPKGLGAEIRATRGTKSLLRRAVEVISSSLVQLVLERFDLKGGAYDAPAYREELRRNSDYCRFDDVLRMVLDCSVEEIADIRALLARMRASGDVDYGLFEVDQALMTCLLFSLEQSEHLHFIDGDEGGFWSAALQFKAQLCEQGS